MERESGLTADQIEIGTLLVRSKDYMSSSVWGTRDNPTPFRVVRWNNNTVWLEGLTSGYDIWRMELYVQPKPAVERVTKKSEIRFYV
jgi:hypothetical protein